MLSSELRRFLSDSTPLLSDKKLMESIFRQIIIGFCVMSMKCLEVELFQLMEWHRSWDSILISIYWIDAHALKNRNAHAKEE